MTSKAPRVIPAKAKATPPAAKAPAAAKSPLPARPAVTATPPVAAKAAPVVNVASPAAAKAPVPAKASGPLKAATPAKAAMPVKTSAPKATAPVKAPAKAASKPAKPPVKAVARTAAPRKAAKPVAKAAATPSAEFAGPVPVGDSKLVTRSYYLQINQPAGGAPFARQIRELITDSLPDEQWSGRLDNGQPVVLTVLPDRVVLRHREAVQDKVAALLQESAIAIPASKVAEGGGEHAGGGFFNPFSDPAENNRRE